MRAHGVHGAVKLIPETDDINRFRSLDTAYLEEKDGSYRPVRVSDVKILSGAVSLRISGTDTVEQANQLRGLFLCVDRENAIKLKEGSYFISDLIGCTVVDETGRKYGEVTDIYEGVAQDVYIINHGSLSFPALKRLLISVDIKNQIIVVNGAVLGEVGLFED